MTTQPMSATVHGYTRHGYACCVFSPPPTATLTGPMVCAGPAFCPQCENDVTRLHNSGTTKTNRNATPEGWDSVDSLRDGYNTIRNLWDADQEALQAAGVMTVGELVGQRDRALTEAEKLRAQVDHYAMEANEFHSMGLDADREVEQLRAELAAIKSPCISFGINPDRPEIEIYHYGRSHETSDIGCFDANIDSWRDIISAVAAHRCETEDVSQPQQPNTAERRTQLVNRWQNFARDVLAFLNDIDPLAAQLEADQDALTKAGAESVAELVEQRDAARAEVEQLRQAATSGEQPKSDGWTPNQLRAAETLAELTERYNRATKEAQREHGRAQFAEAGRNALAREYAERCMERDRAYTEVEALRAAVDTYKADHRRFLSNQAKIMEQLDETRNELTAIRRADLGLNHDGDTLWLDHILADGAECTWSPITRIEAGDLWTDIVNAVVAHACGKAATPDTTRLLDMGMTVANSQAEQNPPCAICGHGLANHHKLTCEAEDCTDCHGWTCPTHHLVLCGCTYAGGPTPQEVEA